MSLSVSLCHTHTLSLSLSHSREHVICSFWGSPTERSMFPIAADRKICIRPRFDDETPGSYEASMSRLCHFGSWSTGTPVDGLSGSHAQTIRGFEHSRPIGGSGSNSSSTAASSSTSPIPQGVLRTACKSAWSLSVSLCCTHAHGTHARTRTHAHTLTHARTCAHARKHAHMHTYARPHAPSSCATVLSDSHSPFMYTLPDGVVQEIHPTETRTLLRRCLEEHSARTGHGIRTDPKINSNRRFVMVCESQFDTSGRRAKRLPQHDNQCNFKATCTRTGCPERWAVLEGSILKHKLGCTSTPKSSVAILVKKMQGSIRKEVNTGKKLTAFQMRQLASDHRVFLSSSNRKQRHSEDKMLRRVQRYVLESSEPGTSIPLAHLSSSYTSLESLFQKFQALNPGLI